MSHILKKVAPIGESRDKELLKSASSYIFESRNGEELLAHVFFPDIPERNSLPAVACFHGGFWDAAMVTQFVPHCHHFASRGAVAVTFEYRISSKNGTGPVEAIEDARSAMEWLCENADVLGIDTARIGCIGASGGAFLALHLAMAKDKDYKLPARPRALVLFSALVNTTPKGEFSERFPNAKSAKLLSPTSMLRRKLPPMIFFHGKSDRVAPFDEITSFKRRMAWRRNYCKVFDFVGAEHSFFNFNVSHSNFETTITTADSFFTEQGVLDAPEEDVCSA